VTLTNLVYADQLDPSDVLIQSPLLSLVPPPGPEISPYTCFPPYSRNRLALSGSPPMGYLSPPCLFSSGISFGSLTSELDPMLPNLYLLPCVVLRSLLESKGNLHRSPNFFEFKGFFPAPFSITPPFLGPLPDPNVHEGYRFFSC